MVRGNVPGPLIFNMFCPQIIHELPNHRVIKGPTPKRGGGYAALLRFGSAAPGLVPAHGVQSPIPQSAAALRNGVLDGVQSNFVLNPS